MIKPARVINYLEIASVVAKNSPDLETQVGFLIVGKKGEVLLSSYNGFISGTNDSKLPKTRPHKYNYFIHAETNAILQAAKLGIKLKNKMGICTTSPCVTCARMLYQVGIKKVYFKEKHHTLPQLFNQLDLDVVVKCYGDYYEMQIDSNKS